MVPPLLCGAVKFCVSPPTRKSHLRSLGGCLSTLTPPLGSAPAIYPLICSNSKCLLPIVTPRQDNYFPTKRQGQQLIATLKFNHYREQHIQRRPQSLVYKREGVAVYRYSYLKFFFLQMMPNVICQFHLYLTVSPCNLTYPH